MVAKEQIVRELEALSEADRRQVADFIAFLRYRTRRRATPPIDEANLTELYAEFGDEDRQLAEQGLTEYAARLQAEDVE